MFKATDIKFSRIVLEQLNYVKDQTEIDFGKNFVNYFRKAYTSDERLSIYNELGEVIKQVDNDFTGYYRHKHFSKNQINEYLSAFYQAFKDNSLYE